MEKDFILAKVSWLSQVERNYEFDNGLVLSFFKNLITYLQDRNLTTRTILNGCDQVTEDTNIKSSDLSDEGLALMRTSLDKWSDKVFDKGFPPHDFRYLDRQLKKIRS